ncbi:IDEAL domain-containing protein [Oceanobacillus locisalsi]|uniref:IDEAL domain-containing protein n=1 Tax=Oceanobacillus locisalsi TaxID=546107 RepID=A0ABW3NDK0_9BACI
MKQEKVVYRFFQYVGEPLTARKELAFEDKLIAQFVLDELVFNWNKSHLEDKINQAIDANNHSDFKQYSEAYKQYVWED